MGTSLVQGGSGLIPALSIFQYISGVDLCSNLVGREYIPSGEGAEILRKVNFISLFEQTDNYMGTSVNVNSCVQNFEDEEATLKKESSRVTEGNKVTPVKGNY